MNPIKEERLGKTQVKDKSAKDKSEHHKNKAAAKVESRKDPSAAAETEKPEKKKVWKP